MTYVAQSCVFLRTQFFPILFQTLVDTKGVLTFNRPDPQSAEPCQGRTVRSSNQKVWIK